MNFVCFTNLMSVNVGCWSNFLWRWVQKQILSIAFVVDKIPFTWYSNFCFIGIQTKDYNHPQKKKKKRLKCKDFYFPCFVWRDMLRHSVIIFWQFNRMFCKFRSLVFWLNWKRWEIQLLICVLNNWRIWDKRLWFRDGTQINCIMIYENIFFSFYAGLDSQIGRPLSCGFCGFLSIFGRF
jgi:hypothetical protein